MEALIAGLLVITVVVLVWFGAREHEEVNARAKEALDGLGLVSDGEEKKYLCQGTTRSPLPVALVASSFGAACVAGVLSATTSLSCLEAFGLVFTASVLVMLEAMGAGTWVPRGICL